MWFHIDPSSATPIYLQIVEQVRRAVADGALRPGQRLPATRELAVELAINPNTVVKAYQVLERQGLIKLPRGLGAFVAEPAPPAADPARALEQLRPAVENLAAQARLLGCDADEVLAMVRSALAGGPPPDGQPQGGPALGGQRGDGPGGLQGGSRENRQREERQQEGRQQGDRQQEGSQQKGRRREDGHGRHEQI